MIFVSSLMFKFVSRDVSYFNLFCFLSGLGTTPGSSPPPRWTGPSRSMAWPEHDDTPPPPPPPLVHIALLHSCSQVFRRTGYLLFLFAAVIKLKFDRVSNCTSSFFKTKFLAVSGQMITLSSNSCLQTISAITMFSPPLKCLFCMTFLDHPCENVSLLNKNKCMNSA